MEEATPTRSAIALRLLFGLLAAAVLALLYRSFLVLPQFRLFGLTLVSLALEALPYLLLGAAAATVVAQFMPAGRLAELAPRLGPLGIPIAALSGIAAPVCECAIVPTVARLREKGLSMPYAMTILVAVPLVNPVVLLSTMAAFPGRPALILARFAGGYAVAVLVGAVFWLTDRDHSAPGGSPRSWRPQGWRPQGSHPRDPRGQGPHERSVTRAEERPAHSHIHLHIEPTGAGASAREAAVAIARGTLAEFLDISRYFVVGAALASFVQVMVPPDWFAGLATSLAAATAVMIAMAFVLSVCSEADAFIGKAFLPLVPAPAVIAFLVFGPMLDLKNTAMLVRVVPVRAIVQLAVVLVILVSVLSAVLGVIW